MNGSRNGGGTGGATRGRRRQAKSGRPEPLERPAEETRDATQIRLLSTLESDVIPRLLLMHRERGRKSLRPAGGRRRSVAAEDVERMVALVQSAAPRTARRYVAALRADGVALDSIFLELLAPTARRLGELWERDTVDFTVVTSALIRLHQLLHELALGPDPAGPDAAAIEHRRILLAVAPGEQHHFGVAMVSEFFRRAGWDIDTAAHSTRTSLVAAVRGKVFDIVGISLACDTGLKTLTQTVQELRAASLNPLMGLIVGGPAFVRNPGLALQIGADATAADARAAVGVAEDLLKEIQSGVSLQPRMAFSWNISTAPN